LLLMSSYPSQSKSSGIQILSPSNGVGAGAECASVNCCCVSWLLLY
jgi:hypothetical protein